MPWLLVLLLTSLLSAAARAAAALAAVDLGGPRWQEERCFENEGGSERLLPRDPTQLVGHPPTAVCSARTVAGTSHYF